MDIIVRFPGSKRVDAEMGGFIIRTDQPVAAGGQGTAPAPFDLFLASIATCAGIYVLGFCQARGIPTENIRLVQREVKDPVSGLPQRIGLEVHVPADFPTRHRDGVARAAAACKVKKTLANPPLFDIVTVAEAEAEAPAPQH